jgi:hypothetical protein
MSRINTMSANGRDHDFPNVREKLVNCVRCDGVKNKGTLLCWDCFRIETHWNAGGFSNVIIAKLALAERACQ